ncbi:hypothetical protein ACN47E_005386 [Coniothyrium glycines]
MTSEQDRQIGWIGLGSMGLAMATNLQKHLQNTNGRHLKYWNRTMSRGDTLQELGGEPCPTIEDLVQACSLIFISLSDDAALHSITTTILSSGPLTSKIITDTTTVHPETSTSIASKLTSAGALYVSAPVFGATPVAQAGHLLIAVGGPPPAISSISPYLTGVLARAVIPVGPDPHTALLLKTTSNYLTAGLMYLLSEAHTLAAKTGLPAPVLESLVELNLGAYALAVSQRLTSGAYFPAEGQVPRSGLELGIKDVRHGVSLASGQGMRGTVGELYLEAAEEARAYAEGKGRRCDSSGVFGVVRQRAGLEFETEGVRERDGRGKRGDE